ncbi:MAG: dihydroorotate dehydrogenase electron transfer subunit [bacterium]|nr:dihydroorotate dehydrogenase electron transfer subunit [bacterium]
MPAPPPDARSFRSELIDVRPTGDDGVVLRVRPTIELPALRAARFFMLRRDDELSPAIPRPFSVYRVREDGSIEFLIKVMGRGTRALAESVPGTTLVTVGPLGNGWPVLGGDAEPLVMIGGGIGSVPFYMAIEQALAGMEGAPPVAAPDITFVYGAAHAGLLYDIEVFERLGVRVIAATDDGSRGFHGNVVQALEAEWSNGRLPERVRVLTCGPDPMMEAVARVARDRDLPCWLSLETYMGCGVGICNGCAVRTAPGGPFGDWPIAKCCVDGPVFPAAALALD